MIILKKGNVITQITKDAKNTSLGEKERNLRVSIKVFKTEYFMGRTEWVVKENVFFEVFFYKIFYSNTNTNTILVINKK